MVLPKSMRIKGHKCFDHIHRKGRRYNGSLMTLKVVKAKAELLRVNTLERDLEVCKCAIAISSKVSKRSVKRNRLRRIFHEHLKLRLYNHKNPSKEWALISLKPNSSIEEIDPLLAECDKLLKKAGLLQWP